MIEEETGKQLPSADQREEFRRLLLCIYGVRESLGYIGEQAEILLPGECIGEYKKSLIQTEDALLHLENQYTQIIEYIDLNGDVNPPIPLTKVDIDNIHVSANTPQQIENTSTEGLIFICICIPILFTDCYKNL